MTGAAFFAMLGLLTLSYFLDGSASVACGATGLLGAAASLPLFLYLLIFGQRPKTEGAGGPGGKEDAARGGQARKDGVKGQEAPSRVRGAGAHLPPRHHHPAHDIPKPSSKKHPASPAGSDKGPRAQGTKATPKAAHDAIPPRNPPASRPGSAAKGRGSKDKGILEKIGEKAGIHQEECPRCGNVMTVTDKTRPLKTRCPKCNMIIIVK
jgi:ribosomal protein S27AE